MVRPDLTGRRKRCGRPASACAQQDPGRRHHHPARGVVDRRACRQQRKAGRPVMVTAQQQVSVVVPARGRRYDRNHNRLGRAAAGTAGQPEPAPVNGRPGWRRRAPLPVRRTVARDGRLCAVRPHTLRLTPARAAAHGPCSPASGPNVLTAGRAGHRAGGQGIALAGEGIARCPVRGRWLRACRVARGRSPSRHVACADCPGPGPILLPYWSAPAIEV
jgi:hypothetical protein